MDIYDLRKANLLNQNVDIVTNSQLRTNLADALLNEMPVLPRNHQIQVGLTQDRAEVGRKLSVEEISVP